MQKTNLKYFKDSELEASFRQAVRSERKILHIVILHIQEISRRKLYLAKAYPSLFDYLIKEYGYSNAAAQRRIEAARLVTEIPEVSEKIQTGEINLSQIGEIAKAVKVSQKIHQQKVNKEKKIELVNAVLNSTHEQTQKICAEELNIPIQSHQTIKTQKDYSKRIELTLTEDQFKKYEIVKGLLAKRNFDQFRTQDISDVLETAFDFIIDKLIGKIEEVEDIPATIEQSVQTKKISSDMAANCESNNCADMNRESLLGPTSESEVNSTGDSRQFEWRSLTPKRRKMIFSRDQSCQYMNRQTGQVCGSRFNLEVDHIHPKWDGGAEESANLRVLCQEHNLFRYQHGQ